MDKKAGTGCTVVLIVVLILVKIIKEYQSQIIAGVKITGIVLLVVVFFVLFLLWKKKAKEKKEEEECLQSERREDANEAKRIATEAKLLMTDINSASNVSFLLSLQKKCQDLNPAYRFNNKYSQLYSDSKNIYYGLSEIYAKQYFNLLRPRIEEATDLDTLIKLYRNYIQNTPSFAKTATDEEAFINPVIQSSTFSDSLKSNLLNILFSKIKSMEVEPSVLKNDMVALKRPCYLKIDMEEIAIRVRNDSFEYIEDKTSDGTVYLFENSIDFFTINKNYTISLKNILDMHLDGDKLILHLRGAGGHKCYQGDLTPILYSLILKLQAKILS